MSQPPPRRASAAIDGFIVGAYAASPAHRSWDPGLEAELFLGLAADPRVAGLELPWLGRLHPHDEAWLCAHLPERFSVVLTDIPDTVSLLSDDPVFGLASPDREGRARALRRAEQLRDDVRRLNDATGRSAVAVVELHSAPRARASRPHFEDSLAQLQQGDWDGAQVVIEHCDAWVEGQRPEKGFLSLADELRALEDSPFGLSLNWGRSAIELRDADRVIEHIAFARESGRLSGLMFSGAADRSGFLADAWVDAHHPMRRDDRHPWGDPTSLLTEQRLAAAVAAAGSDVWIGVKMGWAHADGTVAQRVQMIRAALDECEAASRAFAG